MSLALAKVFAGLAYLDQRKPGEHRYAVARIPGISNSLVGRGAGGRPCVLIPAPSGSGSYRPALVLRSLAVRFGQECVLQLDGEPEATGMFVVINSCSDDSELQAYFLAVCDVLVRLLGKSPTNDQVARVVDRLAVILERVHEAPRRPVSGLFGELYLIWRSSNPKAALHAWRVDESSRFDFAAGDWRFDVKTTGSRTRSHIVSFDQCNPPEHTTGILASLFVERMDAGKTLEDLISGIESALLGEEDLHVKLHEGIAMTLGSSLVRSMEIGFDLRLAESSLRFFDARCVPGIRGVLPGGVSDVHFRSDLSFAASFDADALGLIDPSLKTILERR